jgi:hypothetical protein
MIFLCIRSRAEGDKRTEQPRPRRWPSLACPVEWHGAGRIGTDPEVGCPVLGGDFRNQLSVPKVPRFRREHRYNPSTRHDQTADADLGNRP